MIQIKGEIQRKKNENLEDPGLDQEEVTNMADQHFKQQSYSGRMEKKISYERSLVLHAIWRVKTIFNKADRE